MTSANANLRLMRPKHALRMLWWQLSSWSADAQRGQPKVPKLFSYGRGCSRKELGLAPQTPVGATETRVYPGMRPKPIPPSRPRPESTSLSGRKVCVKRRHLP